MRIAFFTETFLPKVDGIVTVLCLLLDHLARRGVESIIIAPRLSRKLGENIDRYADTRVIRVRGITFPLYPELKIGPPTLSTYRQLKAFNPHVVHIIHPVLIGAFGVLMAKRLRAPILASFHLDMISMSQHYKVGFLTSFARWHTRTFFNAADYTLAPSRRVQRDMQALGIKDVGLWRRGVDPVTFNPCYRNEEMRYALSDGHPDDNILIYVGRLSTEKQIDHLRPVL